MKDLENQKLIDRIGKRISLAEIERLVGMPKRTLDAAIRHDRSIPMKYREKLNEVLNDLNL